MFKIKTNIEKLIRLTEDIKKAIYRNTVKKYRNIYCNRFFLYLDNPNRLLNRYQQAIHDKTTNGVTFDYKKTAKTVSRKKGRD